MSKVNFAVNLNGFTNTGDLKGMIEFIETAEALGYDSVKFMDHVVGVVADKHPELGFTPYTHKSHFHECFVFMGYMAARTKRIRFITGVLGLPQRQTALVAKQLAEIDILTGGRVTLGAGIGYNATEFEAMGANFKERAKVFEEQVHVMRMLWTQESVEFQGKYHTLNHVNINPAPIQKPIPIWIGSGRTHSPVPPEAVVNRIGRIADGWVPLFRNDEATGRPKNETVDCIERMRGYAKEAGRNPEDITIELGVFTHGKPTQRVVDEVKALCDLGTTHIHARVSGETTEEMLNGSPTARQIEDIKRFTEVMDKFR